RPVLRAPRGVPPQRGDRPPDRRSRPANHSRPRRDSVLLRSTPSQTEVGATDVLVTDSASGPEEHATVHGNPPSPARRRHVTLALREVSNDMADLTETQVRALAEALGVPLTAEDATEVTHRLNAFIDALAPLAELDTQKVDGFQAPVDPDRP